MTFVPVKENVLSFTISNKSVFAAIVTVGVNIYVKISASYANVNVQPYISEVFKFSNSHFKEAKFEPSS